MAKLEEVGERDGWRCWLCDQPVDPSTPPNDPRAATIDAMVTKAKASKGGQPEPRLAHHGCNTKKGAVAPVVPWPDDLIVADPAPLIAVAERLGKKGGREIVGRTTTKADGEATAAWVVDRLSRLSPGLEVEGSVEPGGGQFLVAVRRR